MRQNIANPHLCIKVLWHFKNLFRFSYLCYLIAIFQAISFSSFSWHLSYFHKKNFLPNKSCFSCQRKKNSLRQFENLNWNRVYLFYSLQYKSNMILSHMLYFSHTLTLGGIPTFYIFRVCMKNNEYNIHICLHNSFLILLHFIYYNLTYLNVHILQSIVAYCVPWIA